MTNLMNDVIYLGVDLHCEEQPEAGMRLHRVKFFLQLHQPPRGQMDVLQHHPPAGQGTVRISVQEHKLFSLTNTKKPH